MDIYITSGDINYRGCFKKKYITMFFFIFQLHGEFNSLLMNLVFAELVTAGYGIPVDFTASLQHGWKMGKGMCNATGFLLTLSGNYYMINVYWVILLEMHFYPFKLIPLLD